MCATAGPALLLGLLVCFMLNAILVVVFITRISHNLRRRDARLAAVRQRAAEEEHIVRMGLLASGAAHELGTPLATLAVILGDWKRIPALTHPGAAGRNCRDGSPGQALQDHRQRHPAVCRRGARVNRRARPPCASFSTPWCRTGAPRRSVDTFVYDNLLEGDSPMVADATPGANGFNVLDNARDASPHWVRLQAQCDADALRIVVTDRGPGFSAAVLRHIGTPYQSAKGGRGGLGLFPVDERGAHPGRQRGGTQPPPEGGAEVTITLSLAAITLQDTDSEDHGH